MTATDARMGSVPQPYPSLPASPTLTNPDMILPDYDRADSPDLDDDGLPGRSQSPLLMWKNAHAASSGADLQQLFSGVSDNHCSFPTGTITPTTPIIYGNGTMLSDIGEVTEAESTPGRPSPGSSRRRGLGSAANGVRASTSPSRSSSTSPSTPTRHVRNPYLYRPTNEKEAANGGAANGGARRASPTTGPDEINGVLHASGGGVSNVKLRARQQQQQQQQQQHQHQQQQQLQQLQQHAIQNHARRDSLESNSTVTTQERAGLFADFDDTISIGDSVFQGDDEESVAESYVDGFAAPSLQPAAALPSSLLAVPSVHGGGLSSGYSSDDGADRRHSTASISRRAEEILANAKKRLTTMEDNLTRARSSLYISSPTPNLTPSDGSFASPRLPIRLSATAPDIRSYDAGAAYLPGHARMGSDGSMPLGGSTSTLNQYPQRSASALGAAGGYRKPQLVGPKSVNQMNDGLLSGFVRSTYGKPVDTMLEPLSEDEVLVASDISAQHNRSSTQIDSFQSSPFGPFPEKGLTRSASVAQMRDLKDQMKDLKGKISTLREQARADSLKRRSLQSLRTPSPFTHSQVDQWYAEQQPTADPAPTSKGSSGRSPWNGELSSIDGEQDQVQGKGQGQGQGQGAGVDQGIAGDAVGAGNVPNGSGSHKSDGTSRGETPRLDRGQTEEEPDLDTYDVLDYAETKPRRPFGRHEHEQTESPVLGDMSVLSMPNAIPVESQYTDDMHTENGDASDEEEGEFTESVEESIPEANFDEHKPRMVDEREDEGIEGDEGDGDVAAPGNKELDTDGGYESESGDSLYHDTLQHQISHEDREDAFDYEHFILHSALGTISQQRLSRHSRSDSFSSEDSVETTKGPIVESTKEKSFTMLNRRASASSLSSVDSFATANEGRSSRIKRSSSGSDDDADRRLSDDSIPEAAEGSLTARRVPATFPSGAFAVASNTKRNSAEEPRQTLQPTVARRPASSAAIPGHRPSVSSFESMGTTRSFPLVNRNRHLGNGLGSSSGSGSGSGSGGGSEASSPSRGGSRHAISRSSFANEDLRNISESLLHETASIYERSQDVRRHSLDSQSSRPDVTLLGAGQERPSTGTSVGMASAQSLQMLLKEDRYLVERLVGSLGRCVLGLVESGRASAESRDFRRRIDAARRILEGLEPV